MSNETKNSIYATARYSLLIDDQITFESLTKTKEQIFNSWLEQLYEDKHTTKSSADPEDFKCCRL